MLFLLVMVISQCMEKKEERNDPRGSAYAGAAKCANCHKDVHDGFATAAHNNTSAIASLKKPLKEISQTRSTNIFTAMMLRW